MHALDAYSRRGIDLNRLARGKFLAEGFSRLGVAKRNEYSVLSK